MSYWILIADASGARIFASDVCDGSLQLVREIANPEGRVRTQDLTTDSPGRINKAGASGTRSATPAHGTAHDQAAQRFAHELSALLHQELLRNSYDSLAIIAPPHFLGAVRLLLNKEVEQRVRASVPRDLVHVPADALKGHLEVLLASPAAR